jgi:DNA helicase-2/ATP-dependent DNA helicase PcrA
MNDNLAFNFSKCEKGLIVAPAGCGKTHLIAESAGHSKGVQLILTHTHAGVDALKKKLNNLGVPVNKYHVTTIDSFSLRYAQAFPILGRFEIKYPNNQTEWTQLRRAATEIFQYKAIRRVIRGTYDGIYVDEYQDCCKSQHESILMLAEILPCRIVGDPLQSIYRKLNKEDDIRWKEITADFPLEGKLTTPYRWMNKNKDLGNWLDSVRKQIIKGRDIYYDEMCDGLRWEKTNNFTEKRKILFELCKYDWVVAIRDFPNRCAALAAQMKNTFFVIESVECPDLIKFAEKIENSTGVDRVNSVIEFAENCLTGTNVCKRIFKNLTKSKNYTKKDDRIEVLKEMKNVANENDLKKVLSLLFAILNLEEKINFKRIELWKEMIRVIQIHNVCGNGSLSDTAWKVRDLARRNGKRIRFPRIIATPLLIKGLEFDHAVIFDTSQHKSPEELYVSLTRASRSLTVISNESKLRRDLPQFIREKRN